MMGSRYIMIGGYDEGLGYVVGIGGSGLWGYDRREVKVTKSGSLVQISRDELIKEGNEWRGGEGW